MNLFEVNQVIASLIKNKIKDSTDIALITFYEGKRQELIKKINAKIKTQLKQFNP